MAFDWQTKRRFDPGASDAGEFDSNPVFLLSDRGLGVGFGLQTKDFVFRHLIRSSKRWIFEGCLGFDGVSTPAEFLATFAASLTRTPGLSS